MMLWSLSLVSISHICHDGQLHPQGQHVAVNITESGKYKWTFMEIMYIRSIKNSDCVPKYHYWSVSTGKPYESQWGPSNINDPVVPRVGKTIPSDNWTEHNQDDDNVKISAISRWYQWVCEGFINNKSILVEVIVWRLCGQYLSQRWPRCLILHVVTFLQRPQTSWRTLVQVIAGRLINTSPLQPGLYFMRAYTPTVGAAVYTSVAGCAPSIRAHTPTVTVKVQTCWTFEASAEQHKHSSQSRKRSKVTESRRIVWHRDVCGRIPTHTLACLYFIHGATCAMQWRRTGIRKRGYLRRLPAHMGVWSINPA